MVYPAGKLQKTNEILPILTLTYSATSAAISIIEELMFANSHRVLPEKMKLY